MTVMDTITIANREIALMAFDRLRKEDKKDSALKLARCMFCLLYTSDAADD